MMRRIIVALTSLILVGWVLQVSRAQGETEVSPSPTEEVAVGPLTDGSPLSTTATLNATEITFTPFPTSQPTEGETPLWLGSATPQATEALDQATPIEVTADATQEVTIEVSPEAEPITSTLEAPGTPIIETAMPLMPNPACTQMYQGVVTTSDLERVAYLLNTAGTPPNYPEDIVSDGRIDLLDYAFLTERQGQSRSEVYCR